MPPANDTRAIGSRKRLNELDTPGRRKPRVRQRVRAARGLSPPFPKTVRLPSLSRSAYWPAASTNSKVRVLLMSICRLILPPFGAGLDIVIG